ncbi:MAG: hypothetical protein ACK470_08530, partial [Pseudanabaena sp.]
MPNPEKYLKVPISQSLVNLTIMKEIHNVPYQDSDICPTKTIIYKKIADENMLYALAYFGRSK